MSGTRFVLVFKKPDMQLNFNSQNSQKLRMFEIKRLIDFEIRYLNNHLLIFKFPLFKAYRE